MRVRWKEGVVEGEVEGKRKEMNRAAGRVQ